MLTHAGVSVVVAVVNDADGEEDARERNGKRINDVDAARCGPNTCGEIGVCTPYTEATPSAEGVVSSVGGEWRPSRQRGGGGPL